MKIGFDNKKYLKVQAEHIAERIKKFDNKLYLEFGGKLFDDYHASRVLPGFLPDSKLQILLELKDKVEVIIAINANDIERKKVYEYLGISYYQELLRTKEFFESKGLYVGSVCITHFNGQLSAINFQKKLEKMGTKVYRHYIIPNYPNDPVFIASEKGFGKNEYIKTKKPLIVVTAPGPGSGKMATCLSQLYHEHKKGINAGYAKYETFPVWNLPLNHPVNIAYEAATADLQDVNMIDPFHLEAYGQIAVNYNRDIEIFPVLQEIFKQIYGSCPYKSPTDMGVNMAGYCIIDDEVCQNASKQEIICRYYKAAYNYVNENGSESEVLKIQKLMNKLNLKTTDRPVVVAAFNRSTRSESPSGAIQLPNGQIISAKSGRIVDATSSLIIKALKYYADIKQKDMLISPLVLQQVKRLKTKYLNYKTSALSLAETLLAITTSAKYNLFADEALRQLPKLNGSEAHFTYMLDEADIQTYRKLGVRVTCEVNNK